VDRNIPNVFWFKHEVMARDIEARKYGRNTSFLPVSPNQTNHSRNTLFSDNIKMDLREIGWDGVDWIDLAQDRDQWRALVNMVMNLRGP
jgi:hypothetical protein